MFFRSSNKAFRYTLALLLSFFFCAEIFAQKKWSMSGSLGIANYSLSSLHAYQDYLKMSNVFPLSETSKFPAYLTYGADLEYQFKKCYLGVGYLHGSTGGR